MKKENKKYFLYVMLLLFSIIVLPNVHGAIQDNLFMCNDFDSNLNDITGYNNLSVGSGSAVYTTGKTTPSALNCSGANYFYNNATKNMASSGNRTTCAWVQQKGIASVALMWNHGYTQGTNSVTMAYGLSGVNTWNSGAKDYRYDTMQNNTWAYYCYVWNETGDTLAMYKNGVLQSTTGGSLGASNIVYTINTTGICRASDYGGWNYFNGFINTFSSWNRAITSTEITDLYNGGSGRNCSYIYGVTSPPAPNITFVSQNPSDITSTNLFYNNVNVTYQFNQTGNSIAYINYTLNGVQSCLYYVNGTCVYLNGTSTRNSYNVTQPSGNNVLNVTFNFTENQIYPATSNLNNTLISNGVFNITITNSNSYYADSILNISNITTFNFYEPPVLSNGNVEVYYYNSTYNFNSNPTINNNVHLLCTIITPTTYNHTHNVSGYVFGHQVCGFAINNSGFLGSVKVTNIGGFLIRGNTQGVTITLGNETVRTNVTRSTTTSGTSWTSTTGTIISHLHQYGSNDQFCYTPYLNQSGSLQTDTQRCDNLNATTLPPEPPTVLFPNATNTTFNKLINISWESAIPVVSSVVISNYTIYLYNNDTTINQTIINVSNTTNSYLFNSYIYNLSVDSYYYIVVKATQSDSQTAFGFSPLLNFSTNGEINITPRTYYGNTTILNITNYTIYKNGLLYIYKNNSLATFDIIKNENYTAYVTPTNYSLYIFNFTPTTNYTLYYSYHGLRNTINISLYNGITKTLLTNWSLEIISDLESRNYTTTSGFIYDYFLIPETYSLRYTSNMSPGYPVRNYMFTLEDFSLNIINLTIIPLSNTNNVTFIVVDNLNNRLENAIIKVKRFDLSTNSYPIEQILQTNFEGKSVADIILNTEYYKFVVEYDGNVVLSTEKSYIYGTTLTLQVNLGGIGFEEVFLNQDLSGVIVNTNSTATFYYNDETNTATQSCLYVYSLSTSEKLLHNSSCSTSTAGDITIGFSNTTHNTFIVEGYITSGGKNYLVSSKTINLAENLPEQGRGFGLLMTFILLIVVLFMIRYSLPIAILVGSAIPMFMSMTHLNSLSIEASVGIFILGGIVAYLVGSRT